MNSTRRERTRAVVAAVVQDVDLVGLILAGNIGPSSFTVASQVCKTWLSVCRADERVLRGVAMYQGGLTKGAFMKLFAMSSREADLLPHSTHKRLGGGSYCLYRSDAVDAALAAGGIKQWRGRLAFRAANPCIVGIPLQRVPDRCHHNFRLEERLHAEALRRRRVHVVRAQKLLV